MSMMTKSGPTSWNLSGKNGEFRSIETILLYTLPLAAYYLVFDLWRVFVSLAKGNEQPACDFVCSATRSYGDQIPIVSSVRAKFAAAGSQIDVELARELLFFNVVIGLCLIPLAVLAFAFHLRRFGTHDVRMIRTVKEKGPAGLIGATIFLAAIAAIMSVSPLMSKALVLAHWSGLLIYNGLSLIVAFMLMLAVVFVNAVAQGKREASLSREGMN